MSEFNDQLGIYNFQGVQIYAERVKTEDEFSEWKASFGKFRNALEKDMLDLVGPIGSYFVDLGEVPDEALDPRTEAEEKMYVSDHHKFLSFLLSMILGRIQSVMLRRLSDL